MLKQRSHSSLVLFVSHDEASVKQYSDRIIEMKDGCIIKDTLIKKQKSILKRTMPIISHDIFLYLN